MRWCNVQTNEYDLQAITYPTICTHHKLHNNDENKIPVFPECICNSWQNMMQQMMMMITWAINIAFQSPELKWVSWTHTTPYTLMTKVLQRTSSKLDTPPRDKLYKRLQLFNACEHSCIMMIMGGSKMSKTEYDLKAICILPMTYPKNCAI